MDNYSNERFEDNISKSESYAVENELRKTIQRQKKTIFRLAERNRIWKIICAVMTVVIVVESLALWINSVDDVANVPTTTVPEDVVTSEIANTTTSKPVDAFESRINEILSEMTLVDKIYQMMFVTPEQLTGFENVTAAGETTKTKLNEKKVGGLIYNSTNFESKEQVIEMITNIKSYTQIVPFIATAEDSGDKSQLNGVKADTDYHLPSVSDISAYDSADKIVEEYYKSGTVMTEFGFNTNYVSAPGIGLNDVDTSVIATVSGCAINGYSKGGVSSAIKNFPTEGDSDKNIDQLKMREFEIYSSAISSGVDMIVLSNGVNKNVIGDETPYSMSSVTYDHLKKNLGYKGIIVSSAFNDENISDNYSLSDIAVKSINLGCNMFFCPADIDGVVTTVKDAVESGEIQQSAIDESVKKILSVKLKREIIK